MVVHHNECHDLSQHSIVTHDDVQHQLTLLRPKWRLAPMQPPRQEEGAGGRAEVDWPLSGMEGSHPAISDQAPARPSPH